MSDFSDDYIIWDCNDVVDITATYLYNGVYKYPIVGYYNFDFSPSNDCNLTYVCYENLDKSASISYFVEGITESDNDVVIKPTKSLFNTTTIANSFKNDVVALKDLIRANYYEIKCGDYNIKLKIGEHMVRGFIQGGFTITGCDGEMSEDRFVVRCYRQYDHFLIGEYPVIGFMYNIPNLNCEFEYDLILVDKTKNLEQKILSHRKPTAY